MFRDEPLCDINDIKKLIKASKNILIELLTVTQKKLWIKNYFFQKIFLKLSLEMMEDYFINLDHQFQLIKKEISLMLIGKFAYMLFPQSLENILKT